VRGNARSLRRGQTDAERKLWSRLRDRRLNGVKFRRQHPVGPFVADFASLELGIVIELDGGQHALQRAADVARIRVLEERGYRILRFWDNDVLTNIDGVLERIAEFLRTPHPNPLPKGEREQEDPRPRRGRG
jgi:very-short-patch-repair endonuclease